MGKNMSLIIHPESIKLKEKLSDLLLEYESLTSQICPNIEQEYPLNFGFLEFELYKKDLKLSKLKRKLSLIQIQINNEEKVDINSINRKLKEEFKEYENNLRKHMDELDNAINSTKSKHLSKIDVIKLKAIYKKCVFKLHPDLNKNLTNSQYELFIKMTEAFQNGDLKTLESLYYVKDDENIDSVDEMDKLQELIEDLEEKISQIKESFPYNKKDLLEDSKSSKLYKQELKDLIEKYTEEIQVIEEEIFELI